MLWPEHIFHRHNTKDEFLLFKWACQYFKNLFSSLWTVHPKFNSVWLWPIIIQIPDISDDKGMKETVNDCTL